jgi:chemotaxis methyl-accepting protein methylase
MNRRFHGFVERCVQGYLRQSGRIWRRLPGPLKSSAAGLAYGRHLHALTLRHASRQQYFGTFFLRNRAELELMCHLIEARPHGATLNLSVLACSKGAEVYSIVWALRSARPDLQLRVHAVDISPEILRFAEKGVYARRNIIPGKSGSAADELDAVVWNTGMDQNAPIFERMAEHEMEAMFETEGLYVKVRPWLREGIEWHCIDAADLALNRQVGPQDMVVANRFLCHMEPVQAESALRSIARLVRPGGYLFVSGVDLNVREKVAESMAWNPVMKMNRWVHEGDASLRKGWPLEYWGLEPFRGDRAGRYAAVFQISLQKTPVTTQDDSQDVSVLAS